MKMNKMKESGLSPGTLRKRLKFSISRTSIFFLREHSTDAYKQEVSATMVTIQEVAATQRWPTSYLHHRIGGFMCHKNIINPTTKLQLRTAFSIGYDKCYSCKQNNINKFVKNIFI